MNLLLNLFKIKRIFRTHLLLLLFLFLTFINESLFAQGIVFIKNISPVAAIQYTGDKPQSKTWEYGGYWWTVIPVPAFGSDLEGTYLYRLDSDTSWTKLWKLDDLTNIKADVKSVGGVTHILLKNASENSKPQSQEARLISIEFVAGSPPTYQLWSFRNTTVLISLKDYAETATIDIDNQGRMWMASDGGGTGISANKDIYVKWSASPYSNWSNFINLNEPSFQVAGDDICSIIAFGGNKIGVLWSDQVYRAFRFSYRNDSDSSSTWSTVADVVVHGSPGTGVGDDHINLAAGSDGTIYAAVKTGFDTGGNIRIGLLVRRPNDTWDSLYPVVISGIEGTRPIVLLNETEGILSVFYTEKDFGGSIRYKESSINPISFPGGFNSITFTNESFNDVTSTKQNVGNQPLILFTKTPQFSPSYWTGVKLLINRDTIDTYNGAGYAYYLKGINGQGISVSKTAILNSINSAITLEAWFKTNTTADQEIINYVEPPPAPNEGYGLSLTAAGKIRLQLNVDVTLFTLDSPSDYPIGKWTHVAATYNQSQSSAKLYINGEEVASGTYSSGLGNGNSDDFVIGGRDPGAGSYGRPFNGSLDELRLWNVARSENDIRTFMSKKINPSSIPSSLVAYWNFDKPRAGTIVDITNNKNDGSLVNISSFQFEWSGAAIGDESAFVYPSVSGSFSQKIGHPNGDTIVVSSSFPSSTGLHVYRVDAPPLRIGVPGFLPDATSSLTDISLVRYYGVKVIGSGTPTYDVVYQYLGHPGIDVEANLKLAYRDNLSDDTWKDAGAILNVGQNTLSKTGLTGTEFALASSGNNPLPVELSYFTGRIVGDFVKLDWRTETEVSNYRFDIERSFDGIEFSRIDFIEGHGNSNSPKLYSYSDLIEGFASKVYYRLKQIDTDGSYNYSNIVTVNIGVPTDYKLFQNYPNPFNPNTKISFQVPEKASVTLKVFNSIGEEVAELLNDEIEAGHYELNFNAKNLASGVYIYTIHANGFFASKKMLLLK